MAEQKSALSIGEVAAAIGVSKPVAYKLVRTPGFPCFSLGRRLIVPRTEFEVWLANKAREGAVISCD